MIGIVDCEVHGVRGIAGVSPRVREWLDSGAREVTRRDLVRFRVEGDFPWQRVWADRASAGDLDEQLLSFDQAAEIVSEAACSGCLEDWLGEMGVDISRSREEQRFLRLRTALDSLLLPIIESEHERVAKLLMTRPHEDVAGWGVGSARSCPFDAYVEIRGVSAQLTISVADEGQQLVCTVVNTFFPSLMPPPPVEIALSNGELPMTSHGAIVEWGHSVRRHLEQCQG